MRLLRKVLQWSSADRRLVLESAVTLIWARISLLLFPFAVLARRLGVPQSETSLESDPHSDAVVARVRWAVNGVSNRLPWKSSCLVRALAGQRVLARRRLPATLYFGVRRKDEELQAHAWLRSGRIFVSGDDVMADFTPICSYASPDGSVPTPQAGLPRPKLNE
jgi:Transglutaminase-like superfamily